MCCLAGIFVSGSFKSAKNLEQCLGIQKQINAFTEWMNEWMEWINKFFSPSFKKTQVFFLWSPLGYKFQWHLLISLASYLVSVLSYLGTRCCSLLKAIPQDFLEWLTKLTFPTTEGTVNFCVKPIVSST